MIGGGLVGGGPVAVGVLGSGGGRRVPKRSAVGGGGGGGGLGRGNDRGNCPLAPLGPLNILALGPGAPKDWGADPNERPPKPLPLGGPGAPASIGAKRPNVSSDFSSSGAKFASLSTTTIDVTSVTKLY